MCTSVKRVHCPSGKHPSWLLMSQYWILLYGLLTAIKPVEIIFVQYQPMHYDAKLNRESDFDINHGVTLWLNWVTDDKWRYNDGTGTQRVNPLNNKNVFYFDRPYLSQIMNPGHVWRQNHIFRWILHLSNIYNWKRAQFVRFYRNFNM